LSPAREETVVSISQLKSVLVDRGYQEVITYSFVDKKYIEQLTPQQPSVALANPISADMSEMRTTLWAGLLKTASYNINRQQSRLKLFERGLNFLQEETGLEQKDHIAGLIYGGVNDESWFGKARPVDFYDAKGDVEALLALTGGDAAYSFETGSHPALHPGQTALIKRGEEVIGFLGAVHPAVQKSLDLPQKAYLFELALDGIRGRSLPQFKELSKYPEVRRDFAVIVDEKISAQSILKNVRETAGDLLTGLVLFDVYQGESLEAGKKSIAFGITLQDPNRTLQDEDINPLVERVVSRLKELFNVTLRE
jgi:phenylalanyl-tRNA synthetase beta chain